MKYAKDTLLILMYAAILTFFVVLTIWAWEGKKITESLPASIEATNLRILAEIDTTRDQLLALTDKHATVIERTADERLIAIQDLVNEKSDATLKLVDTHLTDITAPVVMAQANLYGLTKDLQDSLDDLYPDIKAATESATVAVTSAAQTSEAIRDAAPKVSASVEGIASDAKREADSITAPKKWWQKVLGPAYTIGRLVSLF